MDGSRLRSFFNTSKPLGRTHFGARDSFDSLQERTGRERLLHEFETVVSDGLSGHQNHWNCRMRFLDCVGKRQAINTRHLNIADHKSHAISKLAHNPQPVSTIFGFEAT